MASYQGKVNREPTFRPSVPRLMDQGCDVLRYHHYGFKIEIEAYLSHLAVDKNVAASTQNQVFNALKPHLFSL